MASSHHYLLANAPVQYVQYSRNKKRDINKHDKPCRQYYTDLGEISHLQVLLPGHLLELLLQPLHGLAVKHPGISKIAARKSTKCYFPPVATYVTNWVRECTICIQNEGIDITPITRELFHVPERDVGPEDLMQTDLLRELPRSGGYKNIITAFGVFLRYACAYTISLQSSEGSISYFR